MKTRIAITLLAIAHGCACGDGAASEPDVAPPEKSWDEMGLGEPGVEEISNLVNAPQVNEGDIPRTLTITERGGMPAIATEYAAFDMDGNPLAARPVARPAVVHIETLNCKDDGTDCTFDTTFRHMGGEPISDADALRMGLPDVSPLLHVDNVHSEPHDFWATGPQVGAPSQPPTPPFTACNGTPDLCMPGFEPWCNGGAGFLSPGGIAETASGCRGSAINYGGPGAYRPDNATHDVSYWNGTRGSCNDVEFTEAPALKYAIDTLNGADRYLPPPYRIRKAACDPTTRAPWGYGLCADGVRICPLDAGITIPALVDVMYQFENLTDVPQTHPCVDARNAQAGRNRANGRTIGCTMAILEKDQNNNPMLRSWHNGYDTHNYWTRRGNIIVIDPAAVVWHATRAATTYDRGGLNQATREWYINIHVSSHELGHSLGLTHAYIGADGAPRWRAHTRGGWVPEANIVPYSVMHRNMPAAPYTTALWSSGLLADLQNIDLNNTGGGNLEGWRMSNSFRSVYDGQQQFLRNSFAPPLAETNNEL